MTAARSCRPRAAALVVGCAPSEVGIYAATVTDGPLGSTHTYVLFTPGLGVLLFGRERFMPASVVSRWGPKVESPCLAMLDASPTPAANMVEVVELAESPAETPASWWSTFAANTELAVEILESSGAAEAVLAPFRQTIRSSESVALLLQRVERAKQGPEEGGS